MLEMVAIEAFLTARKPDAFLRVPPFWDDARYPFPSACIVPLVTVIVAFSAQILGISTDGACWRTFGVLKVLFLWWILS